MKATSMYSRVRGSNSGDRTTDQRSCTARRFRRRCEYGDCGHRTVVGVTEDSGDKVVLGADVREQHPVTRVERCRQRPETLLAERPSIKRLKNLRGAAQRSEPNIALTVLDELRCLNFFRSL